MTEYGEYIGLLRSLIATPSVSGQEKAAADLLESWIREHVCTAAASGKYALNRVANNVWIECGCGGGAPSDTAGCKPILLLNSHIDTVKPSSAYTRDPFEASVEGDRLYGLGSNDDGGSLVALLAAFVQLSSREQPYRLIFSATAGEENCAPDGIELFLPCIGKPSLGIIGEPTGMRMAVAEKGLLVLDCTTHGITGHAARNEGVNAIYKAVRDIEWFRTYEFGRLSEFLGPVRMNVTMIQSGTQHNVVPAECRFTVDVRPNGEYSNEEILSIVRSRVSCDVVPRSLKHCSSRIPKSHPLVQRGLSLGLDAYGSPTTSNRTRCDFPTLKIGPGDSARSHSADEYIGISEIEKAVGIYVELLDGLKID